MPRFHRIDNKDVQFTAAEETQRDADEAKELIDQKARKDAATEAANKKISGKQKLKDLGLDDDEIKALTGA
tara:strand:+ start:923 stop:1135 length:213 start_codon:yes stop_codon:yes gene_type:complete